MLLKLSDSGTVTCYRRCIQFQLKNAEDFIDYLHITNRNDDVATLFCDIINRPNFESKRNKTRYQLLEELRGMVCEYADEIQTITAEAVLRDVID